MGHVFETPVVTLLDILQNMKHDKILLELKN